MGDALRTCLVACALVAGALACAPTALAAGKTQTLTITSTPPSPALVGGTYKVEAKTTSELPIPFTSATEAVCTVSEPTPTSATVKFNTAGKCKIEATQPGNTEWEPALPQSQEITVKRAQTLAITSTPPSPGLVGSTYEATATATSTLAVSFSSATPTICTVSGSKATFIAEGECKIEASQPGNEEWAAAPAKTQPVTVVKRPQTLEFTSPPPPPGLVGDTYNVAAKATSTLAVSFSSVTPTICTVSGSKAKFIAEGECKIEARQPGT